VSFAPPLEPKPSYKATNTLLEKESLYHLVQS
jgi:hypothetical protein